VQLESRLENPFGYSFRYPKGFIINPFEELYGIYYFYTSDPDVLTGLYIESYEYSSEMSVDQVLDKALKGRAKTPVFEEPVPLMIGGVEGLSVVWSAKSGQNVSGGRVAVVPQGGNRFFKLVIECQGPYLWGSEISAIFQAIADSVIFFKPEVTPCFWAEDETYGLTPENPIRIGGGGAGWERIKMYFYGLSGPGGLETVHYQWTESLSHEDTMLDVYLAYYETEIGSFGPETNLYFDRSSYERPMAPDGFACMGSHFPFGEP